MRGANLFTPAARPAWIAAAVVVLCFAAGFAAEKSPFTKHDKAFYLSSQEQSFIRPGLDFEILEASIDEEGVVSYRFRITDPRGLPLDRDGVFTPGPVRVRSVIATLPGEGEQYTAYTTRVQESPITGDSEEQAAFEQNQGTFERVGDGEYVYTFATRAPADFDPTDTHTVAAWAQRDLSEFDLGENFDADTYDFVPDGSEVTVVRDVVRDETCNQCHGQLSAHDNRTKVALCVTCHSPQTVDPDTGNTADFKVMIHKIHMGAELPSVQDGEPFQIIGFGGRAFDYSTVEYPADIRRCETCHTQSESGEEAAALAGEERRQTRDAGVPSRSRVASLSRRGETPPSAGQVQGGNYLTRPSRATCGSCHDDVNFATGANHAGLPQVSDNQCMRCHAPQGELPFDLSIIGSHTVPESFEGLPGVNFEILNVTDTGPGENPTVRFSIRDDEGNPILPSEVSRLSLLLAGNSRDISQFFSESASRADGSDGVFFYTFERPIPEDATGTWAVGIEGQAPRTILEGTESEVSANDAGENKVYYFPVTDSEARPRRTIVSQEKCLACHYDLALHGGPRKQVEYCVLCHNPNTTDVARRPEDQMPPETVNFKDMIHRIHTGEELEIDYTVFGFGGTPFNFNEVRYPNDRRRCMACHVDGSEQLPLNQNLLATTAPRQFIDPTPPAAAACLSCHTGRQAAAHADLNISPRLGESCDVCHGQDAEFSVDRVHAR